MLLLPRESIRAMMRKRHCATPAHTTSQDPLIMGQIYVFRWGLDEGGGPSYAPATKILEVQTAPTSSDISATPETGGSSRES